MRRLSALYFILQGAAVLGWWAALALHPPLRAHFLAPGAPQATLLAFWLPDVLILGLGSVAAGAALRRGARWAVPAVWIVAGSAAYATLYCIWLFVAAPRTWAGALQMTPAMLLSLYFATGAHRDHAPRLPAGRPGQ